MVHRPPIAGAASLAEAIARLPDVQRVTLVRTDSAQAMVAGLVAPPEDAPDRPGGLLIVAADVTTDRDDHEQLVPLLDQATALTGTAPTTYLADGGYHSAANLAACAARDQVIVMPAPQAPSSGEACVGSTTSHPWVDPGAAVSRGEVYTAPTPSRAR